MATILHKDPAYLQVEYPYPMTILTRREAADAVLHMCRDCDRSNPMTGYCSGASAYKCNQIKDEIKDLAVAHLE